MKCINSSLGWIFLFFLTCALHRNDLNLCGLENRQSVTDIWETRRYDIIIRVLIDNLFSRDPGHNRRWLVSDDVEKVSAFNVWFAVKSKNDFSFRNNLGYASICNSTGQAIGKLLGSAPLILLTSEDFCNKYLRITPILGDGGILTMKSMWVLIFLLLYSVGIFNRNLWLNNLKERHLQQLCLPCLYT